MLIRKRMFWFLQLIMLVLLFLSSAQAQDGSKSFLWKVKSDKNIVYVHGSIHCLKEEFYPLAMKIENAFDESDVLVLELDLKADPARIQELILRAGLYPDGDSLRNHISRETYDLMIAEFRKYGPAMIDRVEKLRPWVAAITLDALELQRMGCRPELGIDQYFRAKAVDKKVLALETPEFQMAVLSRLNEVDQDALLLSTIRELNTIEKELAILLNAWKTGDEEKMEGLLFGQMSRYPHLAPFFDKMIYQRNRDMTSKIEGYLKGGGTYFVVVGAGHLTGKKGIIDLLRKKGYSVEQL
jgi:uncharacterized protein